VANSTPGTEMKITKSIMNARTARSYLSEFRKGEDTIPLKCMLRQAKNDYIKITGGLLK